ncbi:hypothetical protein QF001_000837 [Paraburkholderia youngii]|uniref:Uncharacterized protein n=1 Tax=Paraburkholderia youngii TaxID=2782701 RepID=A0A7Y6K7P6_9BURK|nr:hypothetical protein [Paraburkholderia youngii]NUY05935.1 hypothetical protein [Paraburkholderia youngii]
MRDPRLIVFLAATPAHHLDTRCLEEIKDGRVHERAIVIAVQTKAIQIARASAGFLLPILHGWTSFAGISLT